MGLRMAGNRPMAKELILDDDAKAALARLRTICLALPDVSETPTFGNPTFKAGKKAFAVLDRYKGEYCIWFRCAEPMRRQLLSDDDAYFPAPYDKAQIALCRKLKGTNWTKLKPLIVAGYELARG
jgi:hypothetical protein